MKLLITTSSIFICILFISFNSRNNLVETEPIRYLALGDSYTIGEGVSTLKNWPNQLITKLKENDHSIKKSSIIAKTGWTTTDLLKAIHKHDPKNYNLVSLMIGVNNQYQNKPFSLFKTEFDSLVDISINLASSNKRVFVLSIPDYGVTPFGKGNRKNISIAINKYNTYIKKCCKNKNVQYINITHISRTLGNKKNALASDKLHPSAIQYSIWVNEIYPKISRTLK